jgi:hypothetical protein
MRLRAQVFGKELAGFLERDPARAGRPFRHMQVAGERTLMCAGEPSEEGLVVPLASLVESTPDQSLAVRMLEEEPALKVFPMLIWFHTDGPAEEAQRGLGRRREENLRKAFFRKMITRREYLALSASVPSFEIVHLGVPMDADSPESRRLGILLTERRRMQWEEAKRRLERLGEG